MSRTKLQACAVVEAIDTGGTGARTAGTLRGALRAGRLAVTCIGPVRDDSTLCFKPSA